MNPYSSLIVIWFGTHAYKDTCWFHIFKSNLPETAESISHTRPAKSPYKSISGISIRSATQLTSPTAAAEEGELA